MRKRKPIKLGQPLQLLIFLLLFSPVLLIGADTTYEVSSHRFEFDHTPVRLNEIKRRPVVVVEKQSEIDNFPEIRMSFWNGESSMRLRMFEQRRQLPEVAVLRLNENARVIYEPDSTDIQQLYKRVDDCFEWEIILNKAPDSNIFRYQLETEGLVFYFQDSVDADNPYFEQPDSVRFSYAVYHSKKRDNHIIINNSDTTFLNYGTGKAFHIYRPRIWDSAGDTLWGEIHIDTLHNLLTITVDKTFLASAIYPVTIDPTFGYTTIGASSSNPGNLSLQVNYTNEALTGAATLDSGCVYAKKLVALGHPVVKVNCYKKSGTFANDSLVASSSQFEVTTTSFAWLGASISGTLEDSTEYVASFHSDDGFGGSLLRFSYDFADSSSVKVSGLPDMNAPTTLTGAVYNNLRYSCYITYVVNQSGQSFSRRLRQQLQEVQ